MLYSILRLCALIIFRLLFRFQVKGIEHIPKKGAFILAANHISFLDPIALGAASARKLNFMARHDLFYNPLFSLLLSKIGVFPIKRDSIDLSGLKEAMRRIKNGNALVLFPEGRRRLNGVPDTAKGGVGFLAAKLNVPVIPAFIMGTDRALAPGAKFIKPAKISVCFGKQIFIERRVPYQDTAWHIMENIRHLSCKGLN